MDQYEYPEDEIVARGAPSEPPIRPAINFDCYRDQDILNREEVAALLGCSVRTLPRLVARGELAAPILLRRRPVWAVGALRRHLLDRIERAARG